MPWDRFPDEEEEEPELPYRPPPDDTFGPWPTRPPQEVIDPEPEPSPPPSGVSPPSAPDWSDILDEAWPVIRDQVVDYARAVVAATVTDRQKIDHAHPTVVATTAEGKKLVVADAKSRSWRTLVQGLIFDVFAAIVAAVALLSGADPLVKETWLAFGVLLLKSVVSAVISYFMRLKITPTIKTDEGEKMALMPIPRPMLPTEKSP